MWEPGTRSLRSGKRTSAWRAVPRHAGSVGDQVDLVIHHQDLAVRLDPVHHLREGFIHQAGIVAHGRDPQRGPLPVVQPIHLRDAHVEPGLQPILEALDHPPLVLQRPALRDPEFNLAAADRHIPSPVIGRPSSVPGYSLGAISSSSYTSSTSPWWT